MKQPPRRGWVTRSRRGRLHLSVFVAMVVGWTAGCGGPNGASDGGGDLEEARRLAEARGWSQEVKWLADGKVTLAEVEASWQRYAECIREGGGDVGPGRLNPLDSVSFGGDTLPNGLSPSAFRPLVEACTPRFTVISGSYAVTHTPRVDPAIVPDLRSCLESKGVQVESDSALYDLANPRADRQGNVEVDDRVMTCFAPYR